jgi:hypothetical protein
MMLAYKKLQVDLFKIHILLSNIHPLGTLTVGLPSTAT